MVEGPSVGSLSWAQDKDIISCNRTGLPRLDAACPTQSVHYLKGQHHEIFRPWFFSWISSAWFPAFYLESVSIIFLFCKDIRKKEPRLSLRQRWSNFWFRVAKKKKLVACDSVTTHMFKICTFFKIMHLWRDSHLLQLLAWISVVLYMPVLYGTSGVSNFPDFIAIFISASVIYQTPPMPCYFWQVWCLRLMPKPTRCLRHHWFFGKFC
jgi:hypothetical protein